MRATLVAYEAGWRHGYRQGGGSVRDLDLFYAWAGEVMVRDLAGTRDDAFLARVRRWTAARQDRAIRRAARWPAMRDTNP